MNSKKIAGWIVVALILFFVIAQPGQAATLVHNILGWLQEGAAAVIKFVSNVFNK